MMSKRNGNEGCKIYHDWASVTLARGKFMPTFVDPPQWLVP
jgi:hypothetical protein